MKIPLAHSRDGTSTSTCIPVGSQISDRSPRDDAADMGNPGGKVQLRIQARIFRPMLLIHACCSIRRIRMESSVPRKSKSTRNFGFAGGKENSLSCSGMPGIPIVVERRASVVLRSAEKDPQNANMGLSTRAATSPRLCPSGLEAFKSQRSVLFFPTHKVLRKALSPHLSLHYQSSLSSRKRLLLS